MTHDLSAATSAERQQLLQCAWALHRDAIQRRAADQPRRVTGHMNLLLATMATCIAIYDTVLLAAIP